MIIAAACLSLTGTRIAVTMLVATLGRRRRG
jgi:hypothetical protein